MSINQEEINEAQAGGSETRVLGKENDLHGTEMKHFNRSEKLSTLLKTTWMNGDMAPRNFPRVQHRETKMKMRRSMEDT